MELALLTRGRNFSTDKKYLIKESISVFEDLLHFIIFVASYRPHFKIEEIIYDLCMTIIEIYNLHLKDL